MQAVTTQGAALRRRTGRRAVAAVRTADDVAVLVARRWVRLPGTRFEVYLFGKTGELHIHRNGGPFGGWSLPSTVYVRRFTQPERR